MTVLAYRRSLQQASYSLKIWFLNPFKVEMPTCSGYHNRTDANKYLDRLLYYQQATGLADTELLARLVPA